MGQCEVTNDQLEQLGFDNLLFHENNNPSSSHLPHTQSHVIYPNEALVCGDPKFNICSMSAIRECWGQARSWVAGQCYYDRKSGTLVVVSPLLLNIHRHKQSVGADHVSLPARKEITPSGKLFISSRRPHTEFLHLTSSNILDVLVLFAGDHSYKKPDQVSVVSWGPAHHFLARLQTGNMKNVSPHLAWPLPTSH